VLFHGMRNSFETITSAESHLNVSLSKVRRQLSHIRDGGLNKAEILQLSFAVLAEEAGGNALISSR
jgi:hypothetical protein